MNGLPGRHIAAEKIIRNGNSTQKTSMEEGQMLTLLTTCLMALMSIILRLDGHWDVLLCFHYRQYPFVELVVVELCLRNQQSVCMNCGVASSSINQTLVVSHCTFYFSPFSHAASLVAWNNTSGSVLPYRLDGPL